MFFLYGAGGHAKVILDILRARNVAVDCVCDDSAELREFCGLLVVRGADAPAGTAIVSIGKNEARRRVVEFLRARGNVRFATAVHPSAVISPDAEIGAGTVVMPGAIVNAGTRVGEHCIVNTGASIDHDCAVADFAHVSPHATLCGGVSVGAGTWIGAGTVVIQGVSVGGNCLVGAGSVVAKNLPDDAFACGNRCKILKLIPPPPRFSGGDAR
ncbi:MAG: acetyltransferase [Candidatus Spyradosoma sp.]